RPGAAAGLRRDHAEGGARVRAAAVAAAAIALLAGCSYTRKWSAPPKGPSLPIEATEAVARELPGCPPAKVYSDRLGDLIQSSGCQKVVYLKKAKDSAEWAKVGPDYPVPPEDDLREAELRVMNATLKGPVKTAGFEPLITLDLAKTLHTW